MNLVANEFHWYVSIWYFDMIMHTLGGIWLAWASIFLLLINKFSWKNFITVVLCVLVVGVAWELFEFEVGELIWKNPLNTALDTYSDLLCDLFGGVLGFGYNFINILKNRTNI